MTLLEATPTPITPTPNASTTNRHVAEWLRFLEQKRHYSKEEHLMELSRSTLDAHRRLDGLDAHTPRIESRIDRFEEQVERRFDALETRFDGLETRFDGLETRFDRLDPEVGLIRDDVRTMSARMEELFRWIGVQEREGRPPVRRDPPPAPATT